MGRKKGGREGGREGGEKRVYRHTEKRLEMCSEEKRGEVMKRREGGREGGVEGGRASSIFGGAAFHVVFLD